MQDVVNSNTCQAEGPDLPNNTGHLRKDKEAITTIYNHFTNPACDKSTVDQGVSDVTITCDAKDGNCKGEIKVYGHLHFNCLAADVPGQPSTHNFCRYHYDNAIYCPVHPCFNRTYF